jgi:hypothetical protein
LISPGNKRFSLASGMQRDPAKTLAAPLSSRVVSPLSQHNLIATPETVAFLGGIPACGEVLKRC